MKNAFNLVGICAGLLLARGFVQAQPQVPFMISYQGHARTMAGTPFTGMGSFKFALVNPPGTYTYWSNDGMVGGGAVPAAIVQVPVSNGVYSVYLGNTTLAGMLSPIPPWVFTNTFVYLRVWFSDGTVAPALKMPDIRIVSAAYAMIAQTVVEGGITETMLANGAITSAKLTNDLSLGGLSAAGRLQLHSGTVPSTGGITLDGGAGSISGADSFIVSKPALVPPLGFITKTQAVLSAESSGGRLRIYDDDQTIAASLRATVGGRLEVNQHDGRNGVVVSGDENGNNSGGAIKVYNGDFDLRVHIDGDSSGAGRMVLKNTADHDTVVLDGEDPSVKLYNRLGDEAAKFSVPTLGGATLHLYQNANSSLNGVGLAGGGVGGGEVRVYNTGGTSTIILSGEDSSGCGRITTQVLEITGGCDLSENFDIACETSALGPGLLVCIDPGNPGQLRVSDRAYDRTVAGVISGAGGIRPGMLMGQEGTTINGKHPVALTGRVYCQADASNGAIQPGDLLTTSDRPGHAMKVTDHARAQGAIIGKAMSSIQEGNHLVLVLVSLQ